MRRTPRTFWLVAAFLSLLLVAVSPPMVAGGQMGGKKHPPPSDPPEKTVSALMFLIHNTGDLGAQLLNDHDPAEFYVDHRITDPEVTPDPGPPDPCVTGWVNSRGGIFAYLYKGSSNPDHPLFNDCHSQVENDPNLQPPGYRGPRTYVLRLPENPEGEEDWGCCTPLGLEPDADEYCTLPLVNEEMYDYGSQRIRGGRGLFSKKVEPVNLDLLFNHTVGEERLSFELQSEQELLVRGEPDGYYRNIKSTPLDTFRIVGIGAPEVCAGFPFSLDIDFWRVEVPEGS